MTNISNSTRGMIIDAFNRLVRSGTRRNPKVADIIEEAGVARSTFYEHFTSRDRLLLEALKGPLSILADAAAYDGDTEKLQMLLEHFRENRQSALDILWGPLEMQILRALARLINDRISPARTLGNYSELHLADMQMSFIRLWLKRETPYTCACLAELMTKSLAAHRAVLAAS